MAKTPDAARLFYGQTNFIKLAFVRLLQAAFSHDSVPPEYRWAPQKMLKAQQNGDPADVPENSVKKPTNGQRQLWIYRANPKRTTGLPAIFVEADPADASIAQLGTEIMRQEFERDELLNKDVLKADIYAGPLFITVKLTVVAKTTTDREILADMLTGMVRHVFRERFLREKIEYLDIHGGDSGEEGDNPENRRFFGEVIVKCQTQFYHYVDRGLYDLVQSVNLDGIKYGTDADDLTPMPG